MARINEGLAVKQQRKRAARACQHRWIIETPHCATSRGLCRRCGATKRFPNAAADAMWQSGVPSLGRWANRRGSVKPKEIRFRKDQKS